MRLRIEYFILTLIPVFFFIITVHDYRTKQSRRTRIQLGFEKFTEEIYSTNPFPPTFDVSPKCNGRIDIVWTYVNGSDPLFLKKQKRYKRNVQPGRFRDYGSLFYSMRSVFKNAKFATKWFLVVESESQIPTFLDQSKFNESNGYQLQVIYHNQLFSNGGDIPTFNSASIESTFDRIPGISECFIYLNDDFFIHNPVGVDFFVEDDGTPKTYLTQQMVPKFCPTSFWSKQHKYTNNALNHYFDTPNKERNRVSHNCYFFKKSILHEINTEFPEEIKVTRNHRFRRRNDFVIPFIHGQYSIERNYSTSYIEKESQFRYLTFNSEQSNSEKVINTLTNSSIICYCLNDEVYFRANEADVNVQAEYFSNHLQKFYPEKTPFEY